MATGMKVYVYFLQLNDNMQGDGLFYGDISALRHDGVTTPSEKRILMFNKGSLVSIANQGDLAWHAPMGPEHA